MDSLYITQRNMGGATWFLGARITWCLRRKLLGQCVLTGTVTLHCVSISPRQIFNYSTETFTACDVSSSGVLSHRAIESVYKECCEENSKERPDDLNSNPSDDLMLTDSTVWAKVHALNAY